MSEKHNLPVIQAVIPLFDYVIALKFSDGANKYFDVSQLFTHRLLGASFKRLKTSKALFNSVKIDNSGIGISWTDGIELDCIDLYAHSKSFDIGCNDNSAAKPKTTRAKKALTPT